MSYLPPALPMVNSAIPFPVDALPLIMQNAINYLQDGGKVPTVLLFWRSSCAGGQPGAFSR